MTRNPFFVQGRVASRTRAAVGGLRVEIVDVNVGGETVLKKTTTDSTGRYEATFTPAKRAKPLLDLQARAFAGDTRVGVSDVRYNATNREILNVTIDDASAGALASEYDALSQVIGEQYKGSLASLEEGGERHDVTYLANKTGWDARAVAMVALASQFSQRTGGKVDAPIFYALFRAGLPATEDAVYGARAATLATAINGAIDAGVIPKDRAKEVPRIVKQLQAISAKRLLDAAPLAGVSTLKEMLEASGLDAPAQKRFADIYAQYGSDAAAFWKAAGEAFGSDVAARLEVDGKLARLTINNATLMKRVRSTGEIHSGPELARRGLHRPEAWDNLLGKDIPVPTEIPGASPAEKRANYAAYLSAQVRIAYPTASVAEMVASHHLKLVDANGGPARAEVVNEVGEFLAGHYDSFAIGMEPVERFVKRSKAPITPEALAQVKRVQRVYQITRSDGAMAGLLGRGIDAAYHVVRTRKETFVRDYAPDLGGEAEAAYIYDRAVQVHHAVLNVAVAYLTASNAPGIGVHSDPSIVSPAPHASDVIAYPTLEQLFGEMDYCECDECRSILSPAAYLVDLLMFIDQPPPAGKENPQTVLLQRRPDIQHLPLTCENTNTALPYIDVVNEVLEYFIANATQVNSLQGYEGHDSGDADSADLLATPRYVFDDAYVQLRTVAKFPLPLPFHQPLESLRRHFEKLEVPLPQSMEALRKSDALERGGNPYGWRDILMEELSLSRTEADLLTTSTAAPNTLAVPYGYTAGTDADIIGGNAGANIEALASAKTFALRVGLTYEELVAILRTRFVNPNSDLIPKLMRLGVPFSELKKLKDANTPAANAAFDALLPTGAATPDPNEYGGDIKAWVRDATNYARIMGLIVLVDPTGAADACNFDRLELRFSKPMSDPTDNSTRLTAVEYIRLLRFIRLWRKLDWTVEQTDSALCALLRADMGALASTDIDTVAKLDAGFLLAIPRFGVLRRAMEALGLTVDRDLPSLLACWSDIGIYGDNALYKRMFLDPSVASPDPAFDDNGYGRYFAAGGNLADHAESLRSAFNLTGDEYDLIFAGLGYSDGVPPHPAATPLNLANVSAMFRRGWLARKLKLSVRELLLLTSLTGIDPFAVPDATAPAILALAQLVQALKDRKLGSAAALYLVWNQDLSGKSAPDPAQVSDLARALRADFAEIDDQLTVTEDPGGDLARARMALAYGQETADAFFAFIDDTLAIDVSYTHGAAALEPAITTADSRIAYDNFRHLLSYTGVLTVARQTALNGAPGVSAAFKLAVNALFARSEDLKGSFFTRYPELLPLYTAYITSTDPLAKRRDDLLAAFRPELSRLRKRQQALQRLSATPSVDPELTKAILEADAAPYPLHAAGDNTHPALDDVIALETPGLAAQFYFRDTATGAVGSSDPGAADLDYAAGSANVLPANTTTPGDAISGIWRGSVETPDAGFYNFAIEADDTATVSLRLNNAAVPLTRNGRIWRNTLALQLDAGALNDIVLTVERVKDTLNVNWETPKRGREVVPPRFLYPPGILSPFSDAYTRYLKAASLAKALALAPTELAYFAVNADDRIGGDGWLNALPVTGSASAATAVALLAPLRDLLDYARIKSELSITDDSLIDILLDPVAASAQADSPLYKLTRWEQASLTKLLGQFTMTLADLAHVAKLRRVHDAIATLDQAGISAASLIAATTNDPVGATVRDLQAALRARYDAADWRSVVQPINDAMRSIQRDALVAYVLHNMRSDPTTAHVDTVDKLFEYFLMDVEMEPCMQTSRVRHALSSVQLFIDRCLMGLETRVSPDSINPTQWDWMKRYRVWEANRKVFLFPENWLDPELRDDKSPFFKEIESELTQSDITEDTAATALLTYLAKLEDVAKLEPCGIYHVEGDPSLRTGDVDHVVARTTGARRAYYYRRREYGYWTPWEAIKLEIEDNPVVPVVWNDRLMLFWLRIVRQQTSNAASPPSGQLSAGMQASAAVNTDASKSSVHAILCWSEYYNGKWQAAKTSDVDRPTELGQFAPAGAGAFVRSDLQLLTSERDGVLFVGIAGRTFMAGSDSSWYFLYNTHSAPVSREDALGIPQSYFSLYPRLLDTSDIPLAIRYGTFNPGGVVPHIDWLDRTVLANGGLRDATLAPTQAMQSSWDAPFFYGDRENTYFVTTQETPKWISDPVTFPVVTIDPGAVKPPPLVFKDSPYATPRLPGGGGDPPIGPDGPMANPGAMSRFVSEDAYINVALGGVGSVQYDRAKIGPAGAISTATIE